MIKKGEYIMTRWKLYVSVCFVLFVGLGLAFSLVRRVSADTTETPHEIAVCSDEVGGCSTSEPCPLATGAIYAGEPCGPQSHYDVPANSYACATGPNGCCQYQFIRVYCKSNNQYRGSQYNLISTNPNQRCVYGRCTTFTIVDVPPDETIEASSASKKRSGSKR